MDIDAPAWPPADVEAADEGVIRKSDPGDFYMKVIAKKFRGVWHYGVITGVVTEWVLEDYGGATQWRAVFKDGDIVDLLRSEVVEAMAAAQEHPPVDADGEARLGTVQSGWVMEDCLHHMGTFSILNAGPLFEEARVKAIMTEKELASPAVNVVTEEGGPEHKAQVDALTREGRTRYPARRQGAAAGAARRQGEWDGRGSGCYRVRRSIVCRSNAAVAYAVVAGCCEEVALDIASAGLGVCRRQSCEAMDTTSPPGQKWAASLVVSRVRAAGIEEDEKDMRKRVTRGRPDAKVWKLMAASSTAQPPGVVKTLTDDKKRKRLVKKRRGKKLTVAELEAHAEAEAEAAGSSKRRVPRARKNKNKQ
eukprot:jgi/Tetstr1/449400/TSEL_036495.t1